MSSEGHPHQYHGMSDVERIAVLEANERNMARELHAMNAKLDRVVTTLNEMSGGKKAVMGMFALIGGVIGVLGTLFAIHPFGKS